MMRSAYLTWKFLESVLNEPTSQEPPAKINLFFDLVDYVI